MADSPHRADHNAGMNRFRSILHIGMGGLYLVLAVAVIYLQHFGSVPLGRGTAIALGILLFLYGSFRLWRGFTDLRIMKRSRY